MSNRFRVQSTQGWSSRGRSRFVVLRAVVAGSVLVFATVSCDSSSDDSTPAATDTGGGVSDTGSNATNDTGGTPSDAGSGQEDTNTADAAAPGTDVSTPSEDAVEVTDATDVSTADTNEPGPTGACRSYRSIYSGVYNDDAEDTVDGTCAFDTSTFVFTCEEVRTVGFSSRDLRTYASVGAFVAEAVRIGQVGWVSATNTELDGTLNYVEAATYDDQGRPTLLTTAVDAETAPYTTETITAWDEWGRPTAATKDFVGPRSGYICNGSAIAWAYDDAAGTVRFSETGGEGNGCLDDVWTRTYDVDMNLVGETLGEADWAEVGVLAVTETTTVCDE